MVCCLVGLQWWCGWLDFPQLPPALAFVPLICVCLYSHSLLSHTFLLSFLPTTTGFLAAPLLPSLTVAPTMCVPGVHFAHTHAARRQGLCTRCSRRSNLTPTLTLPFSPFPTCLPFLLLSPALPSLSYPLHNLSPCLSLSSLSGTARTHAAAWRESHRISPRAHFSARRISLRCTHHPYLFHDTTPQGHTAPPPAFLPPCLLLVPCPAVYALVPTHTPGIIYLPSLVGGSGILLFSDMYVCVIQWHIF